MHEGDNVLTHNEKHTQRTHLTKDLPLGDDWNSRWIYLIYIFLQPLTGLAAWVLVRYYYGVLWLVTQSSLSTPQLPRESCMSEQALLSIGCVIKSTHQGICSCSPIVNFLRLTFYHGMVTSVIFLIKFNLNRHIKHENPLSMYENMYYFQIMSITNLEWFCINCSMI